MHVSTVMLLSHDMRIALCDSPEDSQVRGRLSRLRISHSSCLIKCLNDLPHSAVTRRASCALINLRINHVFAGCNIRSRSLRNGANVNSEIGQIIAQAIIAYTIRVIRSFRDRACNLNLTRRKERGRNERGLEDGRFPTRNRGEGREQVDTFAFRKPAARPARTFGEMTSL